MAWDTTGGGFLRHSLPSFECCHGEYGALWGGREGPLEDAMAVLLSVVGAHL